METTGESAVCQHFQQAAELVGKRWMPQIVRAVEDDKARFSDIRDSVPTISDHVLSQRLKELETAGIVTRTVTPSTPVCISYTLTERGRGLATVMAELAAWAEHWSSA
jgi:DNA-binding HxlR family transcriptional regulator